MASAKPHQCFFDVEDSRDHENRKQTESGDLDRKGFLDESHQGDTHQHQHESDFVAHRIRLAAVVTL
jgi:hypothetical protein